MGPHKEDREAGLAVFLQRPESNFGDKEAICQEGLVGRLLTWAILSQCCFLKVTGVGDTICKEGKGGSVDHLCCRALKLLFEGCPNVEEDKGELVQPIVDQRRS